MVNHKKEINCIKFKSINWTDSKGILEKFLTPNKKDIHLLLVKLKPHQEIPMHKHIDTRYSYVIKGSISDERGIYVEKDLFITRKGVTHSMKAGEKGCEFIIIWQ